MLLDEQIYSITRVISWKNDVDLELEDLSNLSHQLTFTLLNKSSRFQLIFSLFLYKIIMMMMMIVA